MHVMLELCEAKTGKKWSELHSLALLGVNLFVPYAEFCHAVKDKVTGRYESHGRQVEVSEIELVN